MWYNKRILIYGGDILKYNIKQELESFIEELADGYDFTTKVIDGVVDTILEIAPADVIFENGWEPLKNCIEHATSTKYDIRDKVDYAKKNNIKMRFNSYILTNDFAANLAIYSTYGERVLGYLNPLFVRLIKIDTNKYETDNFYEENTEINNENAQVLIKLQYDGKLNDEYE